MAQQAGKKRKAVKKSDKAPRKKKDRKVSVVMEEFKKGDLRSGSKKGPIVTNPHQAIAIALEEARKQGAKIKKATPIKKKR